MSASGGVQFSSLVVSAFRWSSWYQRGRILRNCVCASFSQGEWRARAPAGAGGTTLANRDQINSGRTPPLLHHWRTPLPENPREVQHHQGALLLILRRTHFFAENYHRRRAFQKQRGSAGGRSTPRRRALPTSPEQHHQPKTWWSLPQTRSPGLPSTRSNRQPSSAPEPERLRSTAKLRSSGPLTGGLTSFRQLARGFQGNTPWHPLPRHQRQELRGDRLPHDYHHRSTTPP